MLALVAWHAAFTSAEAGTPGFDARGFTPAPLVADVRAPIAVLRPEATSQGDFYAAALLGYADSPLVATTADGAELPIVDDLFGVDLSAGVAPIDRVRLDLGLPLVSAVGTGARTTGLGDVRLGATVIALAAQEHGFGLGFSPWLALPTGDADAFLGQQGLTGGLLASAAVGAGALTATAQVGPKFQPALASDNLTGADAVQAGGALGYALRSDLGLDLEAYGDLPLAASPVAGTGAPWQLLGAVRWVTAGGAHLAAGGGAGLSQGVGAAKLRLFVGGGFGHASDVAVAAPQRDPDGDTIVGQADACPNDPESVNGLADADGCPEKDVQVSVRVVRGGSPVSDATLHLEGPESRDLPAPGGAAAWSSPAAAQWRITARSGACLGGGAVAQAAGADLAVEVALAPLALSTLRIVVLDGDGREIPGATARITAATPECAPPGGPVVDLATSGHEEVALGVGRYAVHVEAPGFAPYDEAIDAVEGKTREVVAVLSR